MTNPTDAIREEWGHLSDMPENLRKAIDRMEPRTTEAEMNLLHLQALADDLEALEKDFSGTLMEVAG